MTQAITHQQAILEQIQTLTPQQQQEVLNFIEFLQCKANKVELELKTKEEELISAYEAAQKYVGCVESGIGDLSYNKKYLKPSVTK